MIAMMTAMNSTSHYLPGSAQRRRRRDWSEAVGTRLTGTGTAVRIVRPAEAEERR